MPAGAFLLAAGADLMGIGLSWGSELLPESGGDHRPFHISWSSDSKLSKSSRKELEALERALEMHTAGWLLAENVAFKRSGPYTSMLSRGDVGRVSLPGTAHLWAGGHVSP